MAAALEKVKNDLGRDAVILHTRTIRKGGVLGVGAKSIIEITASRDLNVLPPSERKAIIGRKKEQGMPGSSVRELAASPLSRAGGESSHRPDPQSASWSSSQVNDGERSSALAQDSAKNRDVDLYSPFTLPQNARSTEDDSPMAQGPSQPSQRDATPPRHEKMDAFATNMEREMGELRSMVHQLLSKASSSPAPPRIEAPQDVPADLQQFYTELLQNEVAEEIARDVIAQAQSRIDAARQALKRRNDERRAGGKADADSGATSTAKSKKTTRGKSTSRKKASTASGQDEKSAGQDTSKAKKSTKTSGETQPEADQPVEPTSSTKLDAKAERLLRGFSEQEALREIVPVILREVIEQMIPDPGPVRLATGEGTRCVALIGPTGVGKTTTIAKLAAHFKLSDGARVGMITIDTYRIAAVEQLRAYAEILDVPLEVVMTPEEMGFALSKLRHCDLVLIDTSGRSQRDSHRLTDLRHFLDAARRTVGGWGGRLETHLVLSCIAHPQQLAQVTERFSALGLDRVVFTKLDEAVGLGVILNTIRKLNVKLSYLTTGQDVPNHIEIGDRRRIAELVLNGIPEDGDPVSARSPQPAQSGRSK